MNTELIVASIGWRLNNGALMGDAFYRAAIEHDHECSVWDVLSEPEWSKTRPGEILKPGCTLSEFYNGGKYADYAVAKQLEGKTFSSEQIAALKRLGDFIDRDPSLWDRFKTWWRG